MTTQKFSMVPIDLVNRLIEALGHDGPAAEAVALDAARDLVNGVVGVVQMLEPESGSAADPREGRQFMDCSDDCRLHRYHTKTEGCVLYEKPPEPEPPPDPHANFKTLKDNPCLYKWDCPNSWRTHMCIWGKRHIIPHECECGVQK